ncbi:MAG: membrane fusion protein (multidrug efflux system) [Cellvibrionaceae bacterium]|jgi:membrane fusion protein (multidrug efflux system)
MPQYSIIIIVLFSFALVACSEKTEQVKKPKREHLVEVVTAQLQTLAIERERTGTLQSKQEVEIFNQEEGRIITLPFSEGDKVNKGDVVAKLDDRILRSQLTRMQAIRRKAERDVKRISGLANKQMTAQIELTRVETELAVAKADEQILKARLDYATITAPISGLVSQRLSEPGNIAERYTHLLTISDQSTLMTQVTMSGLLINTLEKGAYVDIEIDALPQRKPIKGSVERIHPNLDPSTRTGIVEIALSPAPIGARPGQLARVTLRTQESERLLIPFTALRRSTEGEYVFIVDDQKQAQKIDVVSGLRIGEQVEIINGLSPDQQVITRGFTNLRSKKKVVIISASVSNKSGSNNNPAPIP